MNFIKLALPLLTTCVLSGCISENSSVRLVDSEASPQTIELYKRLLRLRDRGIMLGHQDALAYGHDWHAEPGRSDVKDVTGDYPAVVGWELGHLEHGADLNLDSVAFDDMRRYVQEGHRRGQINTFSWHGDNIVTGNSAWDCGQNTVVASVLPGGEHHAEYLNRLDRLAAFFASLKDDGGKLIPVIFRMYHEHTGAWFWWGSEQCAPEEYKALWEMSVGRLRDYNGLHNLIYAYSPSETQSLEHYLERYPGDEYVDMLGFDAYVPGGDLDVYRERVSENMGWMLSYAAQSGKIACFSETGMEGIGADNYFTQWLYPLIAGKPLSYVLLWRNAWDEAHRGHYFAPYAGHASAPDFCGFVAESDILMLNDIQKMN